MLPIYNPLLLFSFSKTKKTSKELSNKLGPDGLTPLVDYLYQMMTGLLLSDGSLVKKYTGGATYFQMAQSIIHAPFIILIHSIFYAADFCHMPEPTLKTAFVKGKSYQYFSFTTKSILEWNRLRDLWYPKGIKVIPGNIYDLLTPIALAYWLMGDGGWTNKGIHLATHSFTEADVLRLIEVLTLKYGLKCSVHSGNRIYIWTPSVPTFINVVRPHMEQSMMYKVDKSFPKPTKSN